MGAYYVYARNLAALCGMEASMGVFDAGRTLLAVRQYQDTPVPADVIERIVEAAHLTASASNRQPRHVIVIQDRDMLRELGTLARTGAYVAQAPLAVVVAVENSPLAISDGSRAIQSMMLTAWADGVGSNWVGFVGMLPEVKPVLGLPENLEVLAIVPFGYPAQRVGQGKKQRKPLGEVVSREQFGQPFAQD